jgi:glucose-1-phosphate thymidylyltransferase
VAVAREFIQGPTLIVFVDTIIDADLSFLANEEADAVIWVKEVEDPRRFGVVAVDEEGWVQGLIEKPDSMDNTLAIVGCYYFARGQDLLAAIDEQLSGKVQTKGEYYLADAMGLMIQ